ncbi:MAG: short-chain dehydrogenase/reductase [Gemmatimonadetes bacterium]|nr:short-chain dehydrogenase/reductase [Gemmatimonadota bacterium]
MQEDHSGQFAVITGASSGIGLELAKQFAQHGFDVLITSEDDRLGRAADELRTFGVTVDTIRADLAQFEGVESLYRGINALGRQVDAIAINAGVGVGGPFIENDLDDELNLIALNVTSTVHLAKRVVRDMVARNEGRILFTASIAGEMPGPFEAVYAASKAFVLSFSEALRNELKDTNVTVTALQPGATETNFFHRASMDDTKVAVSRKSDPADVAREGYEALMAGKDHVVAAMFKEKVQVVLGQVAPESMKAEQHRKIAEPGSANA